MNNEKQLNTCKICGKTITWCRDICEKRTCSEKYDQYEREHEKLSKKFHKELTRIQDKYFYDVLKG